MFEKISNFLDNPIWNNDDTSNNLIVWEGQEPFHRNLSSLTGQRGGRLSLMNARADMSIQILQAYNLLEGVNLDFSCNIFDMLLDCGPLSKKYSFKIDPNSNRKF